MDAERPTRAPADADGFEPAAVDLRDYVAFDQGRPVDRRVFATDVVAVDLVCLEPGQVLEAREYATADAVYTVLGGTAWVVTDQAEVTLRALQAVIVPAGVVHGLRNSSADPLILQVVISPPDEAPAAARGPLADSGGRTSGSPDRPGLLDRLRRGLSGA
ncbi:MAG: cupin domain-containing protein [Euzebyales bacterium]|nr:cupin domain-containing protein [Euzebyales bacterium]